jgi:membrane associated rhomboid family serine protease
VRGLVRAGEWWRLVTNIFVHVGGMHLALNVLGLWFIGKIAEDMFGAARTVAIFALAGVAGSVASYAASPAGVSAGASGAIFGLIGAVFVELTWQRERHRAAWKIGMWGSLAILTVAQIAIGFMYPIIDQWAHGAGLAVGALAGFALSPHARWQRPARHLARAIAAVFALAVAGAAALVATTPLDASLARGPAARVAVGETSAVVPAGWRAFDGELADPDHIMDVYLEREPFTGDLAQATATWLAREQKRAHDQGFDRIAVATDHVVALPPGWEGSELDVSTPQPDPIGGRLHFRVIAVARAIGGDVVFASLYVPETITRDAPAFFTRLLGSVQ